MRAPTQKEIDAAPPWAVSYFIDQLEGNKSRVIFHERHYGFTLPLPGRDEPIASIVKLTAEINAANLYIQQLERELSKAKEVTKSLNKDLS